MQNNIGIVQGRLTNSPKNRLQYFPKNWELEFSRAKKLKYNFIEFFSERALNKDNPIWDDKKILKYKKLVKKNNLKIINFCDDYVINNSINNKKTIGYLSNLIKKINLLGVKNLILPLYGKSNLTDYNYRKYLVALKKISNKDNKINFYIESNISPNTFKKISYYLKKKNIFFLFDTGNRINLKRDLYDDLTKFFKYIGHIHIKDKDHRGKNVKLTTGLVNFKKIFYILKKRKYKKNFTFETTRGNNAMRMAAFNINFIKKNFK